jgi:membrane-bound metal-dependent hydrolase YbcI (DUF457 family)
MAVKSIAGDRFSLITFGVAQVAIDIEPGIGLLRGSEILHGWTHTYVGATIIAGLVLLVRPLCNWILKRWNAELRYHRLTQFTASEPLRWGPAAIGAFVGTYSHVALDSFMHSDLRPVAPFSASNDLLSVVSVQMLHVGCVSAGILGLMLLIAVRLRRA